MEVPSTKLCCRKTKVAPTKQRQQTAIQRSKKQVTWASHDTKPHPPSQGGYELSVQSIQIQ